MKWCSMFLILLFASAASADLLPGEQKSDVKLPDVVKLEPGKPVSVTVGKKIELSIITTAKKVTWIIPAGVETAQVDGKRLHVWANPGVYTFVAQVPSGDDVLSTVVVLTVIGPRPPPDPDVDPKPKPDPIPDPKPVVVKTFRVIWVVESGDKAKVAVADNQAVRNYLAENTTAEEQWEGWRRYDPQQVAVNETPNMKALWKSVNDPAVQPPLAAPCIVIEVNGKATIEPYPANSVAALALIKKYKEGKP